MKSWKNDSKHETFEAADARRNQLLAKNSQSLVVKVKRMYSDGSFVVKTWHDRAPISQQDDASKDRTDDSQKGKPKTRAQRRALREKRKREREK
jgi:hypothetical protein